MVGGISLTLVGVGGGGVDDPLDESSELESGVGWLERLALEVEGESERARGITKRIVVEGSLALVAFLLLLLLFEGIGMKDVKPGCCSLYTRRVPPLSFLSSLLVPMSLQKVHSLPI